MPVDHDGIEQVGVGRIRGDIEGHHAIWHGSHFSGASFPHLTNSIR
jgi:hypothetical protein